MGAIGFLYTKFPLHSSRRHLCVDRCQGGSPLYFRRVRENTFKIHFKAATSKNTLVTRATLYFELHVIIGVLTN